MQKHSSKPPEVEESALPGDRVWNAAVFQINGPDLYIPLYLKIQSKVWILIFKCVIFRIVQFELLNTISTDSCILRLTMFNARRGWPSAIYSDNGTNFIDSHTLFQMIDFEKIKTVSSVSRIEWLFILSSAPKLVGILKWIWRRKIICSVLRVL